jgi:hypothetical protein
VAQDIFASNGPTATVSSGGTTAPAAGTSETWTVTSSAGFPAAVTGISQFRVADKALPSEIMIVTSVSGTTWTVTRGAESTTPVAHAANWTVYQALTTGVLAGLASAGGANTFTADQYFKSGRPWFDVIAFGADPSGGSDSTAAFNAAILAAVGGNLTPSTTTRTAKGPVYVPAGTYKISSDIQIVSVFGFQFLTAGADCVTFIATGTGFTNAVIYIDGSLDGTYGGFTINGDLTEGAGASGIPWGINLTWNPSASHISSSANTLRNIRVKGLNFVGGINVGATGGAYQDDGSLLMDIVVGGKQGPLGTWLNTGSWQYGIVLGNGDFGNQYDHTLINVGASYCYYGIYCNISGYALLGSQPFGNYCDFYFNYPAAQCSITAVQSQDSQMAIQGTAGASGSKAVSFRDFYWQGYPGSAPPSDYVITITGDITSAWEFSSCYLSTGLSTYQPVIYIDSTYGAPGVAVTFTNLIMANTPSAGFSIIGTNASVVLMNFVELSESTGGTIASFPLLAWNGSAWIPGAQLGPQVAALTFVSSGTTLVNAAAGSDFRLTLTDSTTTLGSPSHPADGQKIVFQVTQGTGGNFTFASYGAAYLFTSALPQPVLSIGAGAVDILGFIYNAALASWVFAAFLPGA